jgi:hypothetical protein
MRTNMQAIANSGHGRVVLTWTDPHFVLQWAPEPTGVYTGVPGTASPYTNSATGSQQFYRLKY